MYYYAKQKHNNKKHMASNARAKYFLTLQATTQAGTDRLEHERRKVSVYL